MEIIWVVVIVGAVIIVVTAAIVTAWAAAYGAPFVPTPSSAVDAALDLAHVGKGDVFVDIGAGNGRVAIAAAKRGAIAIGYELSPFMYLICVIHAKIQRSQATFRLADGFRADVSDATVIYLFLMPEGNVRAIHRLSRTITPNTRVLTYAFPVKEWTPLKSMRASIQQTSSATIRLYRAPAVRPEPSEALRS